MAAISIGYWINPWWRETHTLESANTPDECKSLLVASTSSSLRLWLAKGFIRSQIPSSDAIILWRRPKWLRNSFGTVAVVRCHESGSGTAISVTLRSRYVVAAVLMLWLGGVLIVNLASLYKAAPDAVSPLAVFTLFMLAFGLGFVAFGRLLARDEGPALIDFIRKTTSAQDLPAELRPFC